MPALPAEQILTRRVDDAYATGDTSSSQGTSASSYTDSGFQIDFAKHNTAELKSNDLLGDSPPQLPFGDLVAGSYTRPTHRNLAPPLPHQRSPPMLNVPFDSNRNPTPEAGLHNPLQASQPQLPHLTRSRSRPELPHASRSAPDTRGNLRKPPEFQETDPYWVRFHEESPFEAARRAQRMDAGNTSQLLRPTEQPYVNGRIPSIKPGEIMPANFLRLTSGQPTFSPPLEAPPFPPTLHNPIRPAHFPPSLHPPPQSSDPFQAASHQQPLQQQPARLPRSQSPHLTSSAPPQSTDTHSLRQPPPEVPQINSYQNGTRARSLRSIRSPYQQAPPPNAQRDYSDIPPAPRRHTFVPPGFAPNARQVATQSPPPPVPSLPAHPQHLSPAPTQMASQQPPHHPPSARSALRDEHRYSMPPSPGSQVHFGSRVPSPVRLPSQNVSTPQALGIVHSPPTPSGSPRPDSFRPPRATPKPVMPQLLAPLAVQEQNLGRGTTAPLQRSVTSATPSGGKGGFLSKTKSILRKRTSTPGVKKDADGGIMFAPSMSTLAEENGMGIGKLGKRLSRKK